MDNVPVYFHVDLDAFYASVEQLDNPEHRGKPVMVGASPGHRGVVAACSYEARKFGVRSAMPVSEAFRRCPDGLFLPVRMRRYAEVSCTVMQILSGFSPEIRPISIDEASLDMTGTLRLFGPPSEAARRLKETVRDRTGLSISVGIAPNRYLAKMASDYGKPDGLFQVLPGGEEAFIDAVGLAGLWGIGTKTLTRLADLHLDSLGRIREHSEASLRRLAGESTGAYLYKAVRGIDPGMYSDTVKTRSISNETTFPADTDDDDIIRLALLGLAHEVMFRLFDEGGRSRTLAVKFRYSDFTTFSCRTTLGHWVSSAEELYRTGADLLDAKRDPGRPLRLIGIGFDQVETGTSAVQSELFSTEYDRKGIVEKTVLSLQKKNPRISPVKASLMGKARRGDED